MRKTYENIGAVDLDKISFITPNKYRWWNNWHNHSFIIYLNNNDKVEINESFSGPEEDTDTDELIHFRKIYTELVNDFLSGNIPPNLKL